jgi:hypothetical protein
VWSASSTVAWIAVTSPASGSGSTGVVFTIAANPGASRTGTITIGGQVFTVVQNAACSIALAPASQQFPSTGGSGTISVSTTASCAWTAVSNNSWIAVGSSASGTGNGSITFTVDANTGGARSGTLSVGGQTFTVGEDAGPVCTYSIAPGSQSFTSAGGTGVITVTAGPACDWTASSNADWITVTAGAAGTGNGTVTFSVDRFNGQFRTGTLTVAGKTFTVTERRN